MKKAVLYLRSSKDQRDVSIQSQRHELGQLAEKRGLQLVGEYSDSVESGKDWDRPGFQQLIRTIRNPNRGWEVVLTKDTSRIARRRNLALIFEEQECAMNGVEVVYASMPEGGDPATVMILRTLLQAMDEWHSLISREKGLAGMAETVRQGYRPAGFAPLGYQLKKVDVGIVRDGMPVEKTVLAASADAPAVTEFLRLRSQGIPRGQAAAAAGITRSASSLVSMEWNALTYAGCTTFGVFHERTSSGGYKGKRKRRPRDEWMIQPDTHEALITRAEAEGILRMLETSDHAKATAAGRAGVSRYLLSGILLTPKGEAWEGNKGVHYTAKRSTGKNRYVPISLIETAVMQQAASEISTEQFAQALIDRTSNSGPDHTDAIKGLQKRIAEIAVMIDRAASYSLQIEDPAPYQRKIEAFERERRELVSQQQALSEQMRMSTQAKSITVKGMMEILAELAEDIAAAPPERLKLTLRRLIKAVYLDPDSLDCRVEYGVSANQSEINPVSMALLRGFEPRFNP